MTDVLRIADPSLVVLVGAPGSGKTHWAAGRFADGVVVSSDAMRAMVGVDEHDQRAGTDAFDVLDLVIQRRLKRRLATVVDSTGLDAKRRARWLAAARKQGVAAHVVLFDVDAKVCRERNRQRARPVPAKVLTGQLRAVEEARGALAAETWDGVHAPADVVFVPASFVTAPMSARRQEGDPMPLEFGLQVARFTWPGGPEELGRHLGDVAAAAEESGFTSVWVMDHFLQIPGVGREWEEMLDSYTTLGFLAGRTTSVRLGAMVTGVTYRNLAHLGKIVATLDVLSGGRAWCGLGAAWFEREHQVYGWEFPPLRRRYELLEDALELLPLLWGPGSPRFEGRTTTVPEAICYPRPLQERVPILVGGSGERRTLRLVAQHADACNLFGDAATVRHKVEVLHRHCADVGRDPADIQVTQLSVAEVLQPGEERKHQDAGTVEEQVGRYRELAEAGVHNAIVGMNVSDTENVARFGEVISAFR